MPQSDGDGSERGAVKHRQNMVTVLSQLADDHLTLLRNISTGLAIAGVLLISRSIRLLTKFQAASEIPARFIERNVSLRGKVCAVTEKGLEVEHVPIYLPVLSPLFHKPQDTSALLVHLAGVDLTSEGRTWLLENLSPNQIVWFKLISREDHVLHCLVSQNKVLMWNCSLNEQVLSLGLARTAPVPSGPSVLTQSRFLWRLHKRLHRAEVSAEKRGRGLWTTKRRSTWDRVSTVLWESPGLRLIRRMFKRT
ncbi:protein C3orf33 homolog isoform X2 [Cynoglossus semilaevis]|uniref:protein C3orf33 homolog isoform X2 n=1 Tax=Cynoglossus semilaevis TaxID=244447 RepID=UPI000495A44E|nr:protein C3orf33 homolog isoform X2 [Cynoglossus semilaevis]